MDMEPIKVAKPRTVIEGVTPTKQVDKHIENSLDKKSERKKDNSVNSYKEIGDGNPITLIGDNNLADKEKKLEEKGQKKVKNAVSEVNDKIKQSKSEIQFEYHEKSNRVSIKIVDSDTKEVIKEIPPEDTIKMIEKMWEVAGLLVDQKL